MRTTDRAEVEAILAGIWSTALDGIPVGPDDDYFVLGGDSLAAGWIFAEIEVRLGIEEPPSLLLETPTVASLARRLLTTPEGADVVVPMRTSGSRPLLVAVHDGGRRGSLLWLRALGEQLGDDQPIVGLRPPPIAELRRTDSVSELADRYLAAIDPHLGPEPPGLFGNSFGGLLAYEMGVRLQARGRPCRFVAIGDMPAAEIDRRGRRVDLHAEPRRITPGTVVRGVRRRLTAARQAEPAGTTGGEELVQELRRIIRGHRPSGGFDGPLLVFRTDRHARQGDLGWRQHADGPIEVVDVPGRHADLLRPPNDQLIAAALARRLDP